jgi:N-acetylglucosaminyldiphosphoundecaprenol N-acetyl-beta-D-mannosaminyltransferase
MSRQPCEEALVQFRFDTTTITVNIADKATLLATVAARLAARQGFTLATINLDHLVKLRANPAFRAAYAAQDLVVADGNPIVWLSRLAGKPVSLVPGSDTVLPLARLAAEAGTGVALIGSTDAALQAAAAHLMQAIPTLIVTMCHAPPMGFDPESPEAEAIFREMTARNVGLCFIALSAPKQEIFAARGRSLAPRIGFASIGAGLDFLSGDQTRAPLWVRKIAMEWLWRALSSPRRLIPRYAACFAILPAEVKNALDQR